MNVPNGVVQPGGAFAPHVFHLHWVMRKKHKSDAMVW
jgi:hypothetical protein